MTRAAPIPPLVLVDTREQRPVQPFVHFQLVDRQLATTRVALPYGDYTLGVDELQPRLFIDRKSVGDLISTCTGARLNSVGESESARERFERAMDRAVEATPPDGKQLREIVIEGEPRDVWEEAERDDRRFSALSVFASLQSWRMRWGLVPVWAQSPAGAAWWIGRCLSTMWEEHVGGSAARKAIERGYAGPWVREAPNEAVLEAGARAALRLAWWAEIDCMDERTAQWHEAELFERRRHEGDRSDAGDDLIRVRRRIAALQQAASTGRPRFATAGGMPLSTSDAQRARESARARR